MTAYCTYCSSRKNTAPELLPAIARYQSGRILYVAARVQRDGASFLILSGEFGLLTPQDQIPFYDHLLQPDEVSALSDRVAGQLRAAGVQALAYFTESLSRSELAPYNDAISRAANAVGIPLDIHIITASGGDTGASD